ncbi:putative ABC transporter, periplasmic binding protein [Desulfosarcina variabilis str. Montpellier]|uniref:ABC transporter substrate-binding protein n=1 Tax=Desulfosarcina variabilis TaxID=2300 RepID=UPI003AFA53F8
MRIHYSIHLKLLLALLVVITSLSPVKSAALTIEDEMGRKVHIKPALQRIVVLTSYPAEIICALGCGENIVGVCKPKRHFLPEIQGKPSVGNSAVTPNLEKIVELAPDLVVAYQWTHKDIVRQLEVLDIPVICSGTWTLKQIDRFIKQMGRILGKPQRAEELRCFFTDTTRLIHGRTQRLAVSQKPRVFLEGTTPYQTSAVGQNAMQTPWGTFMFESPMQQQLEIAGGINCVGSQPAKAPTMSPEWVIENNPDAFIKIAVVEIDGAVVSAEFMHQQRNAFLARPELSRLKATQRKSVFVIHPRLCAGPMQVIGGCYYAKWLHPELFSDLSPMRVHQKMLSQFWGIDYAGAWGAPLF